MEAFALMREELKAERRIKADLLAACIDLVKWEERAADRECRASIGEAIRAAIAKAVKP